MMIEGVTFSLVLATALVDSINPCAIGVLVLLISVLLGSKDKKKLVKIATIYIITVYIVYMLAGLGLVWFQSILIQLGFAKYVGIAIGIFVILMGLVEIKDFFWYGKGFSLMIPKKYAKSIQEKIVNVTIYTAVFLGAFVAVVELPCTGGPYLAITAILAKNFDMLALFYLLIYNLIFVMPLVVIAFMAYYGKKMSEVKKWKESRKKWMRLAAGIVMILLGAFLIYYYVAGVHL